MKVWKWTVTYTNDMTASAENVVSYSQALNMAITQANNAESLDNYEVKKIEVESKEI